MKRLIFASLVFYLSGCCLHAASLRNIFVEQALNQLDSARRCVRTLLGSSSTDPADALSSARTLINQALSSLQNVESRLNTHDGPSASQPPTANRKRRRSLDFDASANAAPLDALISLSKVEDYQRHRHAEQSVVSQAGQREPGPAASKRRLLSDQDAPSLSHGSALRSSEQDTQAGGPPTSVATPVFYCKACSLEFETNGGLYNHNKNKHMPKKYLCRQLNCHKAFAFPYMLRNHLKKAHEISQEKSS